MSQPSVAGAKGPNLAMLSVTPVSQSDTSRLWVPVSSCLQKWVENVFLLVCYAAM